jgi:hypothetical protein
MMRDEDEDGDNEVRARLLACAPRRISISSSIIPNISFLIHFVAIDFLKL